MQGLSSSHMTGLQTDANQHGLKQMAQVAHQLKTPLSSAILYTEHLAMRLNKRAPYAEWIARLQTCHASLAQQIEDLLLLTSGDVIKPACISVQAWCEQLLERAQPWLAAHAASLMIDNQLQKSEISLHNESFTGAILNLILNALQAQAKEIRLGLAQDEGGGLQLKIVDNGYGMTDDIKERAFIPFFTTKARGTGLGLVVVDNVMKAHGGKVVLESVAKQGSCITISLPGNSLL